MEKTKRIPEVTKYVAIKSFLINNVLYLEGDILYVSDEHDVYEKKYTYGDVWEWETKRKISVYNKLRVLMGHGDPEDAQEIFNFLKKAE